MVVSQFIEDKKLVFVDAGDDEDSDSFWGGSDTVGEHFFELFMTADNDGPTPEQVNTYLSFTTQLSSLEQEIIDRARGLIPYDKKKKFDNSAIELNILTVLPDDSEQDIEMNWTVSSGWLLFKSRLDFFVTVKENKVLSVELNS